MEIKTTEQVKEFFQQLYGAAEDIKISKEENRLVITVSQMYSFVPVDFKHLKKIGEFFNTDKVNGSDGDYYEGCETCNYGSSYEVDFVVEE